MKVSDNNIFVMKKKRVQHWKYFSAPVWWLCVVWNKNVFTVVTFSGKSCFTWLVTIILSSAPLEVHQRELLSINLLHYINIGKGWDQVKELDAGHPLVLVLDLCQGRLSVHAHSLSYCYLLSLVSWCCTAFLY